MTRSIFVLAAMLMLAAGTAQSQSHSHKTTTLPPGCGPGDTALRCASLATPAFAADGTLHLTWVAGGRVAAARSSDHGRTFTPPILLNPQPESMDANGEARPVVAADGKGHVAIAYTIRGEKGYTGTVMLAVSTDGGGSFAPARRVTADPASQRFPNLAFDSRGRLLLTWIDKRAKAAVMAAWSDDGGATLRDERVLAGQSCECCRIALAAQADGSVLALWRQIFPPNIRDHAMATINADGSIGPARRLAEDNWRVDACPHHGPALAVESSGTAHAAWYTAGSRRQGLFYMRAEGEPRALGNPDNAPSHAQVLAEGNMVWVAWKEFDGKTTRVQAQSSTDGGNSWSSPLTLAETVEASDHPLLVADPQGRSYLSWVTRAEGWRLLALPGGQP